MDIGFSDYSIDKRNQNTPAGTIHEGDKILAAAPSAGAELWLGISSVVDAADADEAVVGEVGVAVGVDKPVRFRSDPAATAQGDVSAAGPPAEVHRAGWAALKY